MVVVGIDLGTAHCSVAVSKDGQITVLENEHGQRKTPSVVAFTEDEILIGQAALNQISSNTANTIFNVKRIIGRQCSSFDVHKNMQGVPYHVEDNEGIPMIQVTYKGENKKFFAEQITAMLLTKMKETVVMHVNEEVTGAVITVPANFTSAQRRATQQAALIAGIPLMALVNEPVAAAITFAVNREIKERRNVLIYHLGAAYFAATVLTIEHGIYSVKAVVGNSNIGGDDFNDRLVNDFARKFHKKHGYDILAIAKARTRLRMACEKAKKELCDFDSASIKIDAIGAGIDFEASVTRTEFAAMSYDLWGTMRDSVIQALTNARMGVQEIEDVVAVGSATRMPIIREVLTKHCGFEAGKIRKTINIDEAAVMGAAELAAVHSYYEVADPIAMNGITSNALMVSRDGEDSFIVGRGTSLPMECSYTMTRNTDLLFTVYEMELLPTWLRSGVVTWDFVPHQIGKYHESLGKYETRKSSKAQAKILFKFDLYGLLEVKSEDANLVEEDGLSQERMRILMSEADYYQIDDKKRDRVMKKLHELERGVYDLQKRLQYGSVGIIMKQTALDECNEKILWIKENKNPSMKQVNTKLEELDVLRDTVFGNTQQSLSKSQNWPSSYNPPRSSSPIARNCPASYSPESYGETSHERHWPSEPKTQQTQDGWNLNRDASGISSLLRGGNN